MLIELPQQYLVRQELQNAKYSSAIANNPIEPLLGVWLRVIAGRANKRRSIKTGLYQ